MTVSATKTDASNANVLVKANGLKSLPSAASMANTGKKLTIVVASLLGRWVDGTGSSITSGQIGDQVRFQLCYTNADVAAFQADVGGFGALATVAAQGDLDAREFLARVLVAADRREEARDTLSEVCEAALCAVAVDSSSE